MLAVVVMGLLSAGPEVQQLRFAVPALTTSGVDATLAVPLTERLVQRLVREGAQVITAREISAVLGLQRERELLGCESDDVGCFTEIAGALGVDALVLGGVAQTGAVYELQLRAVSSASAATLASWSGRVQRLEDVFPAMNDGAREFAADAARALGRTLKPDTSALAREVEVQASERDQKRRARLRGLSWPTAIVGAVVAGSGAVLVGMSRRDHRQLSQPERPLSLGEAARLRDRGATLQTVGWTGLAVGAGGLVAAGTLALLGAERSPGALTPSVGVAPQGLVVSIGGRLP